MRVSNRALAWVGAFFWALGMTEVPFTFPVFGFCFGVIFYRLWKGDFDK